MTFWLEAESGQITFIFLCGNEVRAILEINLIPQNTTCNSLKIKLLKFYDLIEEQIRNKIAN